MRAPLTARGATGILRCASCCSTRCPSRQLLPSSPVQYIRCNTKFFSVSARGGGGPILVMPFSATGKLPRGYPLLNGHSAAVLDTAWSPFDEHLLASGSDDATVRIGAA